MKKGVEVSSTSELYWGVFESNVLAIAITDADGEWLHYNDLFFNQLIQSKIPIDAEKIIASCVLENRMEKTVVINNGVSDFSVTLRALPEAPTKYLWLATINPQDSLKKRMSALKNLYRSFIETSFEMILRTSLDGKIIFANSLFAHGFEFDRPRSAKGFSVSSIFENDIDYQRLRQLINEKKKVDKASIFFRKKGGARLTGLVNAHLHHDQNGNEVINWTILDISQQVESEDVLKSKNEQLGKVNHQMEKFLYSTSHDLRSPLTTILGLVNLVKRESDDAVALSYIDKIEVSTQKLDRIIHDIMSFSRATYKHTTAEKIDFDLLVWKVINTHRNSPIGRKIHFDVKANVRFPFYGDLDRIEIVIDNIIRNAIQFHDVNKSRPFVQVNITSDGSSVHLEFVDNGIGIGHQYLTKIFNMFYKATHTSHGAGLGLYIVKETLEKLEGIITTESEIGFGTVFRVSIPNDKKAKLIARKLQLLQH